MQKKIQDAVDKTKNKRCLNINKTNGRLPHVYRVVYHTSIGLAHILCPGRGGTALATVQYGQR